MDKAGFFKELRKYLAILNESEQKDILDEYTQHIDMKMEKGMSEPEAIKDFGDIKELASEILEAYHVNPQFGNEKRLKLIRKEEIPVQEMKDTGKHIWSSMAGAAKSVCAHIGKGAASLWNFAARPFRAGGAWWKSKRKDFSERDRKRVDHPAAQRKTGDETMFQKAGNGLAGLTRSLVNFVFTCVRWFWNGCMIFAAIMLGCGTLFGIYGLGTVIVLLAQGYPLAGITIGCLGLVMCGGAATVFAISLMRRKHTDVRDKKEEEIAIQEVPEHA